MGIAALLVLLALAPAAPGAVRIGGLSLLWWYAGVGAPLVATALAIHLLARTAE